MPDFSPMGGSGLTFDAITSSIGSVLQAREADLRNRIGSLSDNATTGDLLVLQQQIQQWTMLTQIQSTIVKEVGDALKGIVQKSA